jgi:hypothetical protein
MNGRTTTVAVAGLAALGIFAAGVAARSESTSSPGDRWALASGGPNEAWKLNTRTGELYYCIPAQARPKVVCSR